MIFLYLGIGILAITGIIIAIIMIRNNKKIKEDKIVVDSYFTGAALTNIINYKNKESQALKSLLANYKNYSKEKLYSQIESLANKLIIGQNDPEISPTAFQKSLSDSIILELKNKEKKETIIINYTYGYINVVMIFKSETDELYQLLMKFNVQDEIIYLDSYNASIWAGL